MLRDYSHMDTCQKCWDGRDLICCDVCPASYHPACIGMTKKEATSSILVWACPHHRCSVCDRNTSAAGGLLFRCEVCDNAYCEDHRPDDSQMVGECEHFQALGQIHPNQACFILCNDECVANRADLDQHLQGLIKECEAGERSAHDVGYNEEPVQQKKKKKLTKKK
eukprot:gene17332-23640_t